MAINAVVQGFSKTNRWLLYTSMMLAPAQGASGIGSNCPSNIGFLAYNWYTQIIWYRAVRSKELHALSLVPVHINMTFALSYLGGVTSGNIWVGILLGLGTIGVIILNSVSAWISYATNQVEGYGQWQFFFFGWRTLTVGWHKFFLVWQIGDVCFALACSIAAIAIPIAISKSDTCQKASWWLRYPIIPLGAVIMLFIGAPLIVWMELIVSRNNIESETDWVAVYVFAAQVATMMLPSCSSCLTGVRKVKEPTPAAISSKDKGANATTDVELASK
ncbi:hypothetical protein B0J11DRAFT_20923 [Dendryphion nanum]|uniref:Uncharacterized protein n=1 Tax=Dendryphion nanum TaxID=256645 RepID=A0A9P9EK78_9PLEO|nr:hypothetical protein B0J11DRAFT_20923 [Dendryphion nanum]